MPSSKKPLSKSPETSEELFSDIKHIEKNKVRNAQRHLDACEEILDELAMWCTNMSQQPCNDPHTAQMLRRFDLRRFIEEGNLQQIPPVIQELLEFMACRGVGQATTQPRKNGRGDLILDGHALVDLPRNLFALAELLVESAPPHSHDGVYVGLLSLEDLAQLMCGRLGKEDINAHAVSQDLTRLRKALLKGHFNPYLLERSNNAARLLIRLGPAWKDGPSNLSQGPGVPCHPRSGPWRRSRQRSPRK